MFSQACRQCSLKCKKKELKSKSIIKNRKFKRYKKSVKLPQLIVFNMGVLEDHRYHSLHMITKSVTSLSTNRTNSLEKTNKNISQIIFTYCIEAKAERSCLSPQINILNSNRNCMSKFWKSMTLTKVPYLIEGLQLSLF